MVIAILDAPGSMKQNKTGDWRSERPIIENCSGCGKCTEICPEACIKIIDKKAQINLDYCKGCGICAKECPFKAIKMVREKEVVV
jgi:2-oxoacid:acceptor oxidoreductase delta subunit (pyruvate/2-ketoisovalerate family)